MTILIIHYHLRASGVTRVIQTQAEALRAMGHEVVVASSGPVEGWSFPTLIVPELDYQREGSIPTSPLLNVEADLWIIHNPTLGLNAAYPAMIEAAAESGISLLLQIHDFVEDGRPANYQLIKDCPHLYPNAPHIHYATINRRDLAILEKAGLPSSRCHYLPNAVDPPEINSTTPQENLILYPVRGIRRKNLGELCLLAAHAPKDTSFAVALRSSSEEPSYIHDDWVAFAAEQGLPVAFDVVSKDPESFPKWLERASHLITTSISEGFGLTFLDPAFLRMPLIGRNLPEITRDFAPYGTLYQSLPVPLSELPELTQIFRTQLQASMSAYGRALTDHEIDAAWQEFSAEGTVDFGNLPESLQRKIIKTTRLPWLQEWLESALQKKPSEIDTTPWSIETYSKRLTKVISSIEPSGDLTWINPTQILDQFIAPAKFHFLRAPLDQVNPRDRKDGGSV